MSEKIKTAVMEVIKAHMDGEDKNTKAVLSDIIESVNELETLEQEPTYYPPCQDCNKKMDEIRRIYDKIKEQQPCDDAIDREELLKAIDTWDKFGVDDTNSLFRLDNLSLPHYVPYIHYDDVIKCIKGMPSVTQKSETVTEFADRCRECGAKYGKLLEQKSGKWIPISERLPEDKTYVLTTIKVPNRIAHARSSWYEGGFFHNDNGDTWKATDMEVKAWMPLPEPYEPQESEEKE